jgi:hypothetical protein
LRDRDLEKPRGSGYWTEGMKQGFSTEPWGGRQKGRMTEWEKGRHVLGEDAKEKGSLTLDDLGLPSVLALVQVSASLNIKMWFCKKVTSWEGYA